MTLTVRWILLGLVVAAGVAAWTLRTPDLQIEKLTNPGGQTDNGPAMCPWRDPESSMRRFFPGATSYRTDVFALGRLRQKILQKLGPGARLETNAFYAYPVLRGKSDLGAVLVRRVAGPHGAIEVTVAVSPNHEIVGVYIQRQREPEAVARPLASQAFLGAFKGKTADSDFTLGAGIPSVPDAAEPAATAVSNAIRALLIEYTIAHSTAPAGPRPDTGAHH